MEDNLYEIIYDPELEGVNAISLVSDPAIEVDFFAFNKETKQVKQVTPLKSDEAQRMLISPAMIPNKKIFRGDIEGEEGYVYFSEETVRQMAYNYLKNHNHSTSLEHKVKVDEGVYIVESWIVESDNDKAFDYGFDVPRGTWMVKMHIENPILWDKFIASGEIKGFSVEMFAKLKKINKTMKDKFKTMLQNFLKEMEVEVIKIDQYEVSEFAIDGDVMIEGVRADGEFTIEHDGKIAIVRDGKIVQIDEIVPEVEVKEEIIEKIVEDDKEIIKEEIVKEEIEEEFKEVIIEEEKEKEIIKEKEVEPRLEDELKAEIIEKTAEIEALKAEVEVLKAEKEKVASDFEAFMAQTPASKGVSKAPKVSMNKEESFLDMVRRMKK